jgi:hypothetical protein
MHMMKNVTYLRFEFFDTQGKEQGLGFYIGDWKQGDWHQVVGTWVGNEYFLHVDGKLVSRNRFEYPPDFQSDTRVYAGSNFLNQSAAPGELAGIQLMNRALSTGEVAQRFQSSARPR